MREVKNGVNFTRSFWPNTGTKIPSKPDSGYDLNSLWEDFPDQAEVFVAEAIMAEICGSTVDLDEEKPRVTTFLWTVGGDTLTVNEPLEEMIKEAWSDSGVVNGEEQADEARQMIANLEKLERVIVAGKVHLAKLIETWEISKEQK